MTPDQVFITLVILFGVLLVGVTVQIYLRRKEARERPDPDQEIVLPQRRFIHRDAPLLTRARTSSAILRFRDNPRKR